MRTETKELLGFSVPVVGIAETLQEAITAAGSEAAVLKDYNANVLYHSHFTILRRVMVQTLVKLTGIKQLTESEGEGEKKKEVIIEKDAQYIARLETELGEDGLKVHEAALAEACGKIAVDYTPGTRGQGGTATPAKKWLAYYDQLVLESKLDGFCERNSIDQNTDEETLKFAVANRVREIVSAKMAAAAKEALDA